MMIRKVVRDGSVVVEAPSGKLMPLLSRKQESALKLKAATKAKQKSPTAS
jgi:hypothetical protein